MKLQKFCKITKIPKWNKNYRITKISQNYRITKIFFRTITGLKKKLPKFFEISKFLTKIFAKLQNNQNFVKLTKVFFNYRFLSKLSKLPKLNEILELLTKIL